MNVRTTLSSKVTRIFGLAGGFGLAAGLILGCSSSSTPGNTGSVTSQTNVSVPVLITDAPSDQLLSFSLTINSINLIDSKGNSVSILSTPTTIEICHLNGIQAPLVTANIPSGTYTSGVITFSNPQITYINSSGAAVTVTPTLATNSYTDTFTVPGGTNPGITIGSSSGALLFDLIASQSVTISGTTVTVSPVFNVTPVPPASALPPQSQNGTGMQQMGTVVSVSGATLVLQPGSGPNITLTTNSSTLLQGFSALSQLTAGELVQVDFTVQPPACTSQTVPPTLCPPTLLATRIQLAPPAATGQPPINLLSGPVTSVSSGSFKMAVMQVLGPTVMPTAVASSIFTINDSSATFATAPQFVSMTSPPFVPSFTAANLTAGQTVSVVASSVSGNTATASTVTLMPQTLGGTVTAIATVGSWTRYTLTLASGSAFATLSGASTVTVYTNANTAPPPPSATAAPPAIAVGSTVRFNGMVFNTGGGTFAMIAGCSPDGPPGI